MKRMVPRTTSNSSWFGQKTSRKARVKLELVDLRVLTSKHFQRTTPSFVETF
ncbi:hypothetical protein C1H46_004936 [Malus baccata]|uniref:Uncharacterized protein n=1 Tax=Malus baccata TaxID=106549 RepID=A0A540NFQ7_MALBA|nr:hypothetical protein C1H46_004936 [Malus baccata]